MSIFIVFIFFETSTKITHSFDEMFYNNKCIIVSLFDWKFDTKYSFPFSLFEICFEWFSAVRLIHVVLCARVFVVMVKIGCKVECS